MILPFTQSFWLLARPRKFRVARGPVAVDWLAAEEDQVPVALLARSGRAREQASVGDVIAVVVGERQIGDVGRRVADRASAGAADDRR